RPGVQSRRRGKRAPRTGLAGRGTRQYESTGPIAARPHPYPWPLSATFQQFGRTPWTDQRNRDSTSVGFSGSFACVIGVLAARSSEGAGSKLPYVVISPRSSFCSVSGALASVAAQH